MNIPKGAQCLILPINSCVFSAGYKNQAYYQQQGYQHYGVDLFSDVGNTAVWGCGNGEVVAAGLSGTSGVYSGLGNVVVIIYRNVYIESTGKVMDLTCRMYHFGKVYVKAGDKVTTSTKIGEYGNTGGTTVNGGKMGYHLHLEFDKDTQYPCYAVGISGRYDSIIKRGTVDSTVDPSYVWFIKPSKPDSQTIWGKYSGWYKSDDINLPNYDKCIFESDTPSVEPPTTESISKEQYDKLLTEKQRLETENNSLNDIIESLTAEVNELKHKIQQAIMTLE